MRTYSPSKYRALIRSLTVVLCLMVALGALPALPVMDEEVGRAYAAAGVNYGDPFTNGDFEKDDYGYRVNGLEFEISGTATVSVTAAPPFDYPSQLKAYADALHAAGGRTGLGTWGSYEYEYHEMKLTSNKRNISYTGLPEYAIGHCCQGDNQEIVQSAFPRSISVYVYDQGSYWSEDGTVYHAALYLLCENGHSWGIFDQATILTNLIYADWYVNGDLEIVKSSGNAGLTDGNAAYSLEGASFQLKDSAGEVVASAKTDAEGKASMTDVAPGTYTLVEKKAPAGYEKAADQTVSVEAGRTVAAGNAVQATVSDEPVSDSAGVAVAKVDADTGESSTQGAASLAGAQFTFRFYAGGYYEEDDLPSKASRTWVMQTGADGTVNVLDEAAKVSGGQFYRDSDNKPVLPLGTITVTETKAPDGYTIGDAKTYVSWIEEDSSAESGAKAVPKNYRDAAAEYDNLKGVAVKVLEPGVKGGLVVAKYDEKTGRFTAQGDATLAGAKLSVINSSGSAVTVGSKRYADGDTVCTITTAWSDEYNAYVAKTEPDALPYGTYTVKEVSASKGYLLNSDWSATVDVHAANTLVKYTSKSKALPETPIHGGLVVAKIDAKTGAVAQGNAQLAGAEFTVTNASAAPVRVGDKEYAQGKAVCTITTAWSDEYKAYVAQTAADALPYGTYTVTETKAPSGYKLNDGWSATVHVRERNAYVGFTDDGVAADETVERGNLKLTKADSKSASGKAQGDGSLAGAVYDVINDSEGPVWSPQYDKPVAKGEVVCKIVTNANGVASTRNSNLNGWSIPEEWGGKALAYGSYRVVESGASEGYEVNATWFGEANIEEDGQTATLETTEDVQRGGLAVAKYDRDTAKSNPQGDAKMSGARFAVVNASASPVTVGDTEYAVGKRVCVISAEWDDSYGAYVAKTSADALPYGTYTVTEIAAPDGYLLDGASKEWTATMQVREGGKTVERVLADNAVSNRVKRGNLILEKDDSQRASGDAQGDASLGGASYDVINRCANAVLSPQHGVMVEPGGVVCTIKTGPDGKASTANAALNGWSIPGDWEGKALPYGSYDVVESGASTGYKVNATWVGEAQIEDDGQTVETETTEDVVRGGLAIAKYDRDTAASNPQGDASMEGARFTVTNSSAAPVVVNGEEFASGSVVCTIETTWDDAYGAFVAKTASDALPYGTYTVKEVASPEGYLLDGASLAWSAVAEVREEGVVVDLTMSDASVNDRVKRGNIELEKDDYQRASGKEQGDASLAGAVYDVVNRSAHAVLSPQYGTLVEPGGVVCKIITGDDGKASTTNAALNGWAIPEEWEGKALPYGTYEVVESQPSTGYNLNAVWKGDAVIRQDGQIEGLYTTEDVERGMLKVGKVSRENGKYHEQGAASLEQWAFEVVNKSAEPVVLGKSDKGAGVEIAPGEVVCTITTVYSDGKYVAQTAPDALPYGTYEVHEIQTMRPQDNGYLFDEESRAWSKTFSIRSEGQVVDFTDEEDACDNQVVRGDMAFQKSSFPAMKRLPLVPFLVTSVTTGEHHVVVTDKNGEVDTSSANYSHEHKTNANDKALAPDGSVDESRLDYEAGVWFSGSATVGTEPNDSRGALPFDTYVVEELPASANEGLALVTFEFTVTREAKVVDLGTISDAKDVEPQISTTLADTQGGKLVAASRQARLVDTVSFNNLESGSTYSLESKLYTVIDGEVGELVSSAVVEFAPSTTHGSQDVELQLDTSALEGRSLVCFEYLYDADGKSLASHEDAADEGQTVSVPSISTDLADSATGSSSASCEDEGVIRLTDAVSYTGLVPYKTYTVHGTLHDKDTGEAVLDANGYEVVSQKTFTPAESSGVVELTFSFKDPGLAGKAVVAFETLEYRGVAYAVHADIEDEAQTVYIPSIATSLTDRDTGTHFVPARGDASLVDTVSYENLQAGLAYTLEAALIDAETGEACVNADGSPMSSVVQFTPESANGRIEVPIAVDAGDLPGETVCFERLYTGDGCLCATHEDLRDEGQTVLKPSISTMLVDKASGANVTSSLGDVELVDTVYYKNLQQDSVYSLEANLVDRETGEPVRDASGNPVSASVEFMATGESGTVEVPITVSVEALGSSAVCFERLYDASGRLVAEHADLDDGGQTVRVPSISTTAGDFRTGMNMAALSDKLRITDVVEFEGLQVGAEYRLSGAVHLRAEDGSDAGVLTDAQGNEVVAEATLIPSEASGSAVMTFKSDVQLEPGTTLVVFESLVYVQTGTVAAEHADISDDEQAVHVPAIGTVATDASSAGHFSASADLLEVVDTVTYANLVPGVEYAMTGTVHGVGSDGADAGVLEGPDGSPVSVVRTFVPEQPSGSIEIPFSVVPPREGSSLVVFEELAMSLSDEEGAERIVVAKHADISDEGQTVNVAGIATTAVDARSGSHVAALGDDGLAVRDTVEYKGLEPGATYKLVGTVHVRAADGSDAGTLKDASGAEVTCALEFTPDTSAGTIDLDFSAGADVEAGSTLVVFEELYDGQDRKVAEHSDITDEAQSIHYPAIGTTAVEKASEGHYAGAMEPVSIVDTVRYENLVAGEPYVMAGELHGKAPDGSDAGVLEDAQGVAITAQKAFVPDAAQGEVALEFAVEPGLCDSGVVAFERLSVVKMEALGEGDGSDGAEGQGEPGEVIVAEHADISDEGQTVSIARIGTTLVDRFSGGHVLANSGNAVLVDTVAYEGLKPGWPYVLDATLVDRDTGKELRDEAGNALHASTEFTPAGTSGEAEVVFDVETSDLADATVCFERLRTASGEVVATHEDLDDESQTVYVPGIGSEARDIRTGKHVAALSETLEIEDTVTYENLQEGADYRLIGSVHVRAADGSDEGVLKDEFGNDVVSQLSFSPESPSGEALVRFKAEVLLPQGCDLVVFEELVDQAGAPVAAHCDISDDAQRVSVATLGTHAVEKEQGLHYASSLEPFTIVDTVYYEGLEPGAEYEVSGALHGVGADGADLGVLKDAQGDMVEASMSFTPDAPSGSVDVEFEVDPSQIKTDVVAFERLNVLLDGKAVTVARHEDPTDENQTVRIARVSTALTDRETGEHAIANAGPVSLVDEVAYEGLQPGFSYVLEASLVDKASGEDLIDAEGNSLEARVEFSPDEHSGTVEVPFEVDASALPGATVCFEKLSTSSGIPIAAHEDLEDESQTVYAPSLSTQAIDPRTKGQVTALSDELRVVDTVRYENLLPGKDYELVGEIHVVGDDGGDAGVLKDARGDDVTSRVEFTPQKPDGTIEMQFAAAVAVKPGTTLVVFEKLLDAKTGATLGEHADIADEGQSLSVAAIATTATDKADGDHFASALEPVTIVDTVEYDNLDPTLEYLLTGEVHGVDANGKDTGILKDAKGDPAQATVTFAPESASGFQDVEFQVDAGKAPAKTVVFETLEVVMDGRRMPVAEHADIDDEGQAVHVARIGTTATDKASGDHRGKAGGSAVVVDKVDYAGLKPGAEYELRGVLMDKSSGKPLEMNGHDVESTVKFVPEMASGEQTVQFEIEGPIPDGLGVVVYERLYDASGSAVAAHEDIESRDQAVRYGTPPVDEVVRDTFDKAGYWFARYWWVVVTVGFSLLFLGALRMLMGETDR